MSEEYSDASSDLGGGGAKGFFDVVAPGTLAVAEEKTSKSTWARATPQSGSVTSLGAQRARSNASQAAAADGGGGANDNAESSSFHSSEDGMDSGAVGLFDAIDDNTSAALAKDLVDEKKVLAAGAATYRACSNFKKDSVVVLNILNYQEDKLITHEVDFIRLWDLGSGEELLRFEYQVRRVQRYNHWLFCIDTDSEDILQIDMRDSALKPSRYTGLEDDATSLAIGSFKGSGLVVFAITRDAFTYSWICAAGQENGAEVDINTTFKGHSSNVTSLDLGELYLYTSSTDQTVRVWDYETGKCRQVLEGHTDWVFSVRVIDGQVYSGSRDETVRVWSAAGECIGVIVVGAISYGVVLDSDKLYIRDAAKRVMIYSTAHSKKKGFKELGRAEGSSGVVSQVVHYKNVMVTCASDDPTVRVWSASSGQCLGELRAHEDGVNSIALFNPGIVLSAGEDGTVRKWDLHELFRDYAPQSDVTEMAGSSDSLPNLKKQKSVLAMMKGKARKLSRAGSLSLRGSRSLSNNSGSRASFEHTSGDCPTHIIATFRQDMKALARTSKVKGQYYPDSFTGRDVVSWVKSHIIGVEKKAQAVSYVNKHFVSGSVLVVVVGKVFSDKLSCICKLLK